MRSYMAAIKRESEMEITGTLNADISGITLRADKKNDGQEILVDARIKLTPEDAQSKFGEAFHHVAFACMRNMVDQSEEGDATITRFGYSSKKPPKWLRPSVHAIDLWGVKQQGQPKIQKIEAGDDEAAVYVHLRFTFDANEDADTIGQLGAKCGKTAKIKLKPVQAAAFEIRKPKKEEAPQSTAQKRHPNLAAVV